MFTGEDVFPARAGMSRRYVLRGIPFPGVPRASGDEPPYFGPFLLVSVCSPRERG